jgi:hypothetical protein
MKPKKQTKQALKPVDILLKICLEKLLENNIRSSEIYNALEAEITNANTRYRAKIRINKLIEMIKKDNKDIEWHSFF